jgi:isopropylmalate/homocitrate/citramalate synthase
MLKIKPILYDVSLRDGIQAANAIDYPSSNKKIIFNQITNICCPTSLEIGSLTNPKFFPIFNDSIELYKELSVNHKNLYILIPSISKLPIALKNNMNKLAFITSVSDEFQKINTNKSLEENKNDMVLMSNILHENKDITKKIYISCINYCPIKKIFISNENIVNEIKFYNEKCNFDEICLSDTAGKLSFQNYMEIINGCELNNIQLNLLSLHLHVNNENTENVKEILKFSFYKKINKFDVSMLETGGCTMTLKPEERLANLSYSLFYEALKEF